MVSTDLDALVALYNATGGADWRRNENWNTKAALLQWHAVKVNEQDRVVELSLTENNLKGPIPKERGELSKLEVLWLGSNHLTRPMPKELGALSKLKVLQLYRNQLTGCIPQELGALSKLQEFSLESNQLTGEDGVKTVSTLLLDTYIAYEQKAGSMLKFEREDVYLVTHHGWFAQERYVVERTGS